MDCFDEVIAIPEMCHGFRKPSVIVHFISKRDFNWIAKHSLTFVFVKSTKMSQRFTKSSIIVHILKHNYILHHKNVHLQLSSFNTNGTKLLMIYVYSLPVVKNPEWIIMES